MPLVAGCVTAGSLMAVAVPVAEALFVWKTRRPPVPGPHDQTGVVGPTDSAHDPLTLVWLGDSLASGVGAETPDAAFPRKAAALYADVGRPVHLTCLAHAGSRAADVLADQVPAALPLLGPGAVAVVTVGANDVGSLNRPHRFKRDYAAILRALTDTGATVVAVGLPHMGSAAVMPQPLRAIIGWAGVNADRYVRRLAARHGAHYVSIAVRAPWRTKPRTFLAADHWHPNDATYHLWADRVAALLHPLHGPHPA